MAFEQLWAEAERLQTEVDALRPALAALREENARLSDWLAALWEDRERRIIHLTRERDDARTTKDMHKERQAEAWAEVARLEGLILDCAVSDGVPLSVDAEARRIRAQREEGR